MHGRVQACIAHKPEYKLAKPITNSIILTTHLEETYIEVRSTHLPKIRDSCITDCRLWPRQSPVNLEKISFTTVMRWENRISKGESSSYTITYLQKKKVRVIYIL